MRPLLASLFGTLLLHAGAMAESGPRPPCDNPPIPNYASSDAQPAIRAWTEDELRQLDWRPEGCLSWAGTTHQVIALSGSFSSAATLAALLERLAAVSHYPAIRYWSASSNSWRPITERAWAVDGMLSHEPRPDYSAADLASGRALYYAEEDSRTGVVVYRMRVSRLDADRATISIENASPVDLFFLIKLFDPGALQTSLFLDQLRSGVWRVYEITRTTRGTSMFAEGHLDSYANREIAHVSVSGRPDGAEQRAMNPKYIGHQRADGTRSIGRHARNGTPTSISKSGGGGAEGRGQY
jgi:uncharacterized protein DUF6675